MTDTVDPFGGSYYLESLTNEVEKRALDLIGQIRRLGGVVPALEAGFFHRQIADTAYRFEQDLRAGRRKIVGVNAFASQDKKPPILKIHGAVERSQISRLKALRKKRDNDAVQSNLQKLSAAARGTSNLMPPILDCVKAYATLGEVSDVFRKVWGVHREAPRY